MSEHVAFERSILRANSAPTLGSGRSEERTIGLENLTVLAAKLAFTEFVAVTAVAYATSMLYYLVVLGLLPPTSTYLPSALFIASVLAVISFGFRHYVSLNTQPRHRFMWNGLGAVALAFSFFLSTLFLIKLTEEYSRASFFFQLVAVTAVVLCVRGIGHAKVQSAITFGRVEARRVAVIGRRAHYADIEERLSKAGVQIVRSMPFPGRAQIAPNTLGGELDRNLVRQIIDTCRKLRLDDILILATAADLPRSTHLSDALSELPVSLHVIPVDAGELLGSARLGELGPLVTIQLLQPPLSWFDQLIKRAFDIAVSSIALLLLAPMLIAVSIAIMLDSRGPVLFRQIRHGYNNTPIRVFKFRSMTAMEDGEAFRQATKDDPRVTRVGRIIRRTNIDELPQLLNVLLGEMSIVGPRPHPVALNNLFQQHISPLSRRHNVRPGITGWAQVNGHRGETNTLEKMQRRFECDLYYIDNWSLLLDMKIILMTLISKQAYMNAY